MLHRYAQALACMLLGLSMGYAGAQELPTVREGAPIAELDKAPAMSQWQRDRESIPRDYEQQPPLIPHKIDGYQLDRRYNKCLSCHGPQAPEIFGAPMVSRTHFTGREGDILQHVDPRRYFCTLCHVPQKDLAPLVENTHRPARSVATESESSQ